MKKNKKNKKGHETCIQKNKGDNMKPYGQAYINGWRIIFNPYTFKKGKDKGKIKCYYRKGKSFKKIILKENDIEPIDRFKKE
jgi:hypothetical protein